MRGSNSNAKLESEVESLLLQQQQRNRGLILERERGLLERGLILERERGLLERERGLEINRSGSAPPTVEGALLAAGNLLRYANGTSVDNSTSTNLGVLTEEEIRSHPAYLEYYYSHENLNPRLPPPLLSKEDWRVTQWIRATGLGLGRNVIDNGGSMLLYPMPFGLSVNKAEEEMIELRKAALRNLSRKSSAECLDNGSAGLMTASTSGMGVRRKSFADILQEGSSQPAKSNLSRHASQNSVADVSDSMGTSSSASAELQNKAQSFEAMLPEKTFVALSNTRNNFGSVNSTSLASCASSALNSSRPELVVSGLVALGNGVHVTDNLNSTTLDARNFSTSGIFEIADITASLSGLTLPRGQFPAESVSRSSRPLGISTGQQQVENLINNMNYVNRVNSNASTRVPNVSTNPMLNEGLSFPRRISSSATLPTQYSPSDFARLEDLKIQLQGANFPGVNISALRNGGHSVNQNLDVILGSLLAGGNRDGHLLRPSYPPGFHIPVMDPHQLQYMQKISNHGNDFTRVAGNSSQGTHFDDLQALEKAYLETLLLQQAQQYQSHVLQKLGSMNHRYHVNPAFNPSSASCQGNMALNSQNAREGSRSSTFQNERSIQMPSNMESLKGGSSGSLHSQSGSNIKGRFESLLETLKNNKAKSLELQDILGHVMEFSTDQFGSRFIQQKLEIATVEEKTKILAEIIPNVLVLMIDVFGNYVVQKFFEHGTESQRNELARHLIGHVLPLTLQMYGCRVIQKALEVVDIDIRAKMAAELDGSVTKCVHDQNGNHVIQKCIECIPQDRIQFIISTFLGQVVTLSTHPYGCRVIQRVLEHCGDPKTQDRIMDEIMSSVCKLAQDQYGNYVIQHVVQHGRPHERAVIISKLAGQIVKMSQQKFASNVVEKCLTYGSPQERKLLVNEILGSTDENEPLQAMMKDPFGNYVVQKVLETCDDSSRELILSRIKVHLNALKRYTYGKHIVTRVEKLVVTGEKHIRQSSSSSSSKYSSSVYTTTG